MDVTLYGIPHCDTMKKARQWLTEKGIPHHFHNYKSADVERALLTRFCDELGWANVLNRAGTTFRKLPEADREALTPERAMGLMLAQPGMIKRPVLDVRGTLTLGFTPERYTAALARRR